MRHLDLFSGIGGFALAARWAGFTTIGFCEIDPFCQKVLAKNFPGVPIHDDIRTFRWPYERRPLHYADIGHKHALDALRAGWDGPELTGRVDLITGGFPCQPFSHAGKQRGAADDRHLWPEMARVIAEVRPRWVVGENVSGFIGLGLDDCLTDLEALGYEARAIVIPAAAVGAPHRRDRVWIVAHAERLQGGKRDETDVFGGRAEQAEQTGMGGSGERTGVVAHAEDGGLRRGGAPGQPGLAAFGGETVPDAEPVRSQGGAGEGLPGAGRTSIEPSREGGWQPQSRLGRGLDGVSPWLHGDWERGIPRVASGVPDRVNRLKALGNAVVPQCAYVILSEIAAMDAT